MYGYQDLQNDMWIYNMGMVDFAQWACDFWIIIKLGRPKKTCTLCLVNRLKNGKKCQMKTITIYGIGNQLPIMLGKLPLASPLSWDMQHTQQNMFTNGSLPNIMGNCELVPLC
jgi:hypothetical protein